jgi:hypothetical protein
MVLGPVGVGFEAFVGNQVLQIQELAEFLPPILPGDSHDDMAVFGGEGLERGEHRMTGPDPFGNLSSGEETGKGVFQKRHLTVQHGDIDFLPLPAFPPFVKRGKNPQAVKIPPPRFPMENPTRTGGPLSSPVMESVPPIPCTITSYAGR